MKIFGITITTKKELRQTIAKVEHERDVFQANLVEAQAKILTTQEILEKHVAEVGRLRKTFPLELGQIVYDVALRNEKGRYTKVNPSLEHTVISELVVDEKNYFKLIKRLANKDVFLSRDAADAHVKSVCK